MNKRLTFSATLLLLGASLLMFAQTEQTASTPASLTLIQAQDYALKHAFQIKSAQYDKSSADFTSDEVLGIGLPQVNASVQYQNFIDLPTSIIPGDFFGAPGQDVRVQFGVPHQMTVGLSATQLLFDGTWLWVYRPLRPMLNCSGNTLQNQRLKFVQKRLKHTAQH